MSRRRELAAVVGLATLVTASTAAAQTTIAPSGAALPSTPGSVRGLAGAGEVNGFDGQLAFSVPLAVPEVGRLRPSLALAYDGALGNGPLGLGWSMRAPAIRRATHGGVPAYDDTDELVLEGMAASGRLVPIETDRWAVEGEGERWTVVRIGARFEVTDPDGVRWLLGAHSGARIADGTRVAAWLAETAVDVAGDTIDLSYQLHDGVPYLATVRWADGHGRVELVWGERGDPVVSYATGFRVATSRRLDEVRVVSGVERAATYSLSYDDTAGMARLAEVTSTGRGGDGAWPTLRLGYGAPPAAHVDAHDAGGWVLGSRGTTAADVDGDGVVDLLRLEAGNHAWRPGLLDRYGAARALSGADAIELGASRLLDLDGDGRSELVRIVDDTWRGYRLDGSSWTPLGVLAGTAGVALDSASTAIVDVDGDGRPDTLTATTGGLLLRLGTGAGLGAPVSRGPISAGNVTVIPGAPNVRFADHNGDGLVDALWLTDGWMRVYLGRGDGTFASLTRVFWPWGDGGFDADDVHLTDLDRDGLLDVVRFTAGHVLWWAGRGDHRFADDARHVNRPEATAADVVIGFGDVDGDGATEILWSSPRGMWALHLAGAASAAMLTSIDNGLGAVTRIDYTGTGRLAVAAAVAGAPWVRHPSGAFAVPSQLVVDPGDGAPARVERWTVRDGGWDPAERRFGGFLQVRHEARGAGLDDTVVTTTRFHAGVGEDRTLRGQPWHVLVEDGLGATHEVTVSTWRAVGDLPPLARRAVLVEERVLSYDGVVDPIETRTEIEPDAWGRPAVVRAHGRVDRVGDERVERRVHADDEAHHVRDRVVQLRIEDGEGIVASTTRFLFAGPDGPEDFGVVAAGWPAVTQGLLDEPSGPRWVTLDTRRYNARGLVVETETAGVRRTIAYDDAGMFPIAEAIPALGLTWSTAWDPVLGLALSRTDPMGDVERVEYDALGRVIALARGAQPAHARFEYRWDAPRPEVRSFVFDGPDDQISAAGPWRETVAVSNGLGEPLLQALRVTPTRWAISGMVTRDRRGRVFEEAVPFLHDGDALTAARPAGAAFATSTFDAYGRVVVSVDASGGRTTYRHAAFEGAVTHEGRATVTSYQDGRGRIWRTERLVSGVLEEVESEHDAEDRVVRTAHGGGAAWQVWSYDLLGRMVFHDGSDGGARSFAYDEAGRVIRADNAVGQIVETTYDAGGRVLTRTDDTRVVSYFYDDAARHAMGRLARVTDPTGETALRYDRAGRIIETRRVIDGEAATEATRYSASGLILRQTFDDGLVVDRRYDAGGRLIALGDHWEALQLDAAGRVVRERAGNGLESSFEHDDVGRLVGVAVGAHYVVDLSRDAVGSLVGVTDLDGVGADHGATYRHDGAGRLVEAVQGAYRFTYAYDRLDNLIDRGATGPTSLDLHAGVYTYGQDAGPRQLTSAGGVSLGYDAAGRQLTEGALAMSYDGQDQLLQVVTPDGTLRFDTGFDGQRARTVLPDGSVERWYSPSLRARDGAREHYLSVGDRAVVKLTLRPPAAAGGGASGVLATPRPPNPLYGLLALGMVALLAMRRHRVRVALAFAFALLPTACLGLGGTEQAAWNLVEVTYLHPGPGAGPGLITGATGAVIEDRRYEPFGVAIDPAVSREAIGSLAKPIDETTGWSYHGARWMSPRTARWLSEDPLSHTPREAGFADRNGYDYVSGAPLDRWDPDGREGFPAFGSIDRMMKSYSGVQAVRSGVQTYRHIRDGNAGEAVLSGVDTLAHAASATGIGKIPASAWKYARLADKTLGLSDRLADSHWNKITAERAMMYAYRSTGMTYPERQALHNKIIKRHGAAFLEATCNPNCLWIMPSHQLEWEQEQRDKQGERLLAMADGAGVIVGTLLGTADVVAQVVRGALSRRPSPPATPKLFDPNLSRLHAPTSFTVSP